jgi:general secretion pathway protein G
MTCSTALQIIEMAKKNALNITGSPRYIANADCGIIPLRALISKILASRFSLGISTTRRREAEKGFTLVELLVVLAILGLLIALVAPAMIRQLGSAKHKIAQQSVERLAGILDIYRLDVGDYPSTEQGLAALNDNVGDVPGWNGPYLKDADSTRDPWGRPYQYRVPSQRPKHAFDIVSLGADGKPGGDGEDADIINR